MQPEDLVALNKAQATIPSSAKYDEKAESEQVNVLYSFLENRYAKKVRTALATLGSDFVAANADDTMTVFSFR